MLVSAISSNKSSVYNMSSNMPFYNTGRNETISDTAFNSLTPYIKKAESEEELPKVYDHINEWQNFCHSQIVGKNFNIIA